MTSPQTAIVVGGSLSGLMTSLALARTGMSVTVLERSDDKGRTGGALPAPHGLLERITGRSSRDLPRTLTPGMQSWHALHGALLAAAEDDSRITVLPNRKVTEAEQDAHRAWVSTARGDRFEADLVVGADGHRSAVRRGIAPDHPHATFADYVVWVGLADEADLDLRAWPRNLEFVGGFDAPTLGYPLPGFDGSTRRGSRRLGWAWTDATRSELFRETGSVVGGVAQHSLMPADISDTTYASLAREAEIRFPTPWREAILATIRRRAVIGTPVAEYVPVRLVRGRLALVGDAAHVPTPMIQSGFSESFNDAEALAAAVGRFGESAGIAGALQRYESNRLAAAQNLVRSGQHISRAFLARAA